MQEKTSLSGHAIFVVERGFVFAGKGEITDEWCVIEDALCIRQWGTKRGLGELVKNGPTDRTKLDRYYTVRVPRPQLICTLDLESRDWPRWEEACDKCECDD